jgi:uncharacterized Fe-S cluster-containing protein
MKTKLPGINCGQCGYETCDDFKKSGKSYTYCIALKTNKETYLERGLIDGQQYDFKLDPMEGEASCREFLLSLVPAKLKVGDCISYRPLGCPIPHFAKVVGLADGMIEVLIVGPVKARALGPVKRLGICMVLGFMGQVDSESELPKIGQTVTFIPSKCMMGKTHSAVVVAVEGKKTRLELIDLKVWKK